MSAETVTRDKVVFMNYTLTDESGSILDSSEGEPMAYLQGYRNIIPGLEAALEGLQKGERKKVTVQPTEGYGMRNNDLVFAIPKAQFGGQAPEQGMMVQLQSEEGVLMATIVGITNEEVQLDANHPLAGKVLNFDVEITDIRAASEEELTHGHPHGPGGHHH